MNDRERKIAILKALQELKLLCSPDPIVYRAFAAKADYLFRTMTPDMPRYPMMPIGFEELLTDEDYMRS